MVMNRQEATEFVQPYIQKILSSGYRVILLDDVRWMLKQERYLEFLDDPIRNCGPFSDCVYYWNVIDYLTGYLKPEKIKK